MSSVEASTMAIVETRGLKKHFGEVKAVDGVDIASKEGEFLVLLGPSGCGKTTLLRMIAGLERVTAGEVMIGGRVVTDLPPRARRIAMVFQSYALYPHMTVFKNIAFPLKAQRYPRKGLKDKVRWAATLFGIHNLLERKPRELSGGERQRVALARALVREPSVFLLDEPLSNLDAKLRASAREELQQFQKNIGITTIYVTHDQLEAMGMGDRIAVMNQGRVRQIGTPHEIYHEPADTFVAGFLGSPPMNLVEKGDLIIGFRPEDFLPQEDLMPESNTRKFEFNVTRVEYLGSDRILYGSLGREFGNSHVVAKLPSTVTTPIQEGKHYTFGVCGEGLNFFDRTSGLRTAHKSI